MSKLTHWDYCQFLLVSQVNYTQTYFADHSEKFSHDRINRLMREHKLTPRELRQLVRQDLVLSENGYILFDDTVLDKSHSFMLGLSQCRSQRAQRNHIACAMLVWVRLNQLAQKTRTNVYQIKQGLLDSYMRAQLRQPTISMLPA